MADSGSPPLFQLSERTGNPEETGVRLKTFRLGVHADVTRGHGAAAPASLPNNFATSSFHRSFMGIVFSPVCWPCATLNAPWTPPPPLLPHHPSPSTGSETTNLAPPDAEACTSMRPP